MAPVGARRGCPANGARSELLSLVALEMSDRMVGETIPTPPTDYSAGKLKMAVTG